MRHRVGTDERGMAMALAVMMIALVGVMGAGLIVFAVTDLDTVSEENRGQRAFEMAEAGSQMAKRQLRLDPLPTHYDLDNVVGSVVSPLCNVPPADAVLDGLDLENLSLFPLLGGDWSLDPTNPTQGGAVSTNLDNTPGSDDRVTVSIQWLNPAVSPTDPDLNKRFCAAPQGASPDSEYFRVVSTGEYNGAKRKVEAVYEVYEINLPKAHFARGNVTVTGTSNIQNTSIFSLGNISVNNGAGLTGVDTAYGDWYAPKYNLKRRTTASLLPMTLAGLGAKGTVSAPLSLSALGRNHGGLKHPQTNPPSSTQMSFPFDPDAEPDFETLREIALEQQADSGQTHYYTSSGGTVRIGSPGEFSWPTNSNYRTVVFVDFTTDGNNMVRWQESGSCGLISGLITGASKKGTLIVRGGDFTMQGNDAPLEGRVIVRGGVYEDGDYSGAGNSCLKGYANTSGAIEFRGNAVPTSLSNTLTTPGLYGVRPISWRELYQ